MNETTGLADLLARHVAALLCADPPVLAVYDSDFAANRAVFAGFAREHPRAAVLVQLGWQHETDEAAGRLAEAVAAFRADAPASVRVVALANCPREREQLAARGVEARFVHQNAFLDERRYRPIRAEKRYDAVYLARLTPFKRHVLVPPALAPRLLCIGCQEKPEERDYADGVRARLPARRGSRSSPARRFRASSPAPAAGSRSRPRRARASPRPNTCSAASRSWTRPRSAAARSSTRRSSSRPRRRRRTPSAPPWSAGAPRRPIRGASVRHSSRASNRTAPRGGS